MEVWLKERVLQRYVIENYSKYRPFGLKIISTPEDNKDKFPDLWCHLENGKRVPCEVEWKTSNFDQHGHDLNFIRENEGFLFVCQDDHNLGDEILREIIDIDDFEKWFVSNSLRIIQDTTHAYKKRSQQRPPKLWFSYLSLKGDGVNDFQLALKHHTWGINETYSVSKISDIQKGDLIAFVGPGRKFPGRVNLKDWVKKSFKGYFETIQLYKVTKGYFKDDKKIWEGKGKWKGEVFPHRFEFDPKPVVKMNNIIVNRLSSTTKQALHGMVYSNIKPVNPSTLVDILYNAE
jgi:hypothetical protein